MKKKYIYTALIISTIFLGLFGAVMAGFPFINQGALAETKKPSSAQTVNQKVTTPQAKTPAKQPVQKANYESLRQQLLALTQGKQGIYGVYFKDLKTGQTFGINSNRAFIAASTYKVPLNLYLYEKIINGEIDPNTQIAYQASDYEEGTGILQATRVGTKFSIKYLSEISITHSDNIAKNMLERYLGGRAKVLEYMANLEAKTIPNDPYVNNFTSPRDMSIYMEEVLRMNSKYPEIAGKLMADLKHTIFNDRISAPIPTDVEVAHKIGTQINVVNDTAIVFAKERPYILTIMTDKIDYSEAYPTVRAISKKIYDYQVGLN